MKDWLQAGLVALALFVLYAATAPRTVALEDDAFFILASYYMGVAHPPGYPLHSMLGKLFTLLPFGSVAYRVHLLSAAFGALTCAGIWLCARALVEGRIAAYLAAFGLGLSPAFWSQAIIAEVYTLNTFFFTVLLYLGLAPGKRGVLPAMALLFGLSLTNHWPLMVLAAPALAVLVWAPLARLPSRLPLLLALAVIGLAPYAWMVWRSWYSPIAFYGPIEYLHELWFYVSRQGYAQSDVSATAGWLDRARFMAFLGGEALLQFAVAGTLLAAAGFVVQWRLLGRRLSAALTLGFLMPSVVLLLLLGFDYDALHKHVFQVYPLPAYAVVALWMAVGFAWLARRYAWGVRAAAAASVVLAAVILAVSAQWNLRSGYDWTARFAGAVLGSLPPDANLFLAADSDTGPIAYFHLVEDWRPDVTLYQSQGLILGNRPFHPMRAGEATRASELRSLIERESGPLAFMQSPPEGYSQRHRGLYISIDKAAPGGLSVELPAESWRFLQESLLGRPEKDPWTRMVQARMRERFGGVLGMSLDRKQPPDAATAKALQALAADFFGALGIAEGMLANRRGYSFGQVAEYLEKARDRMPADIAKDRRARFFELRAYLRLEQGDTRGAIEDLETAVFIWPVQANRAASSLADLYRVHGDEQALKALRLRIRP